MMEKGLGFVELKVINMKKASKDLPDIPVNVKVNIECNKKVFKALMSGLAQTSKIIMDGKDADNYPQAISQSYRIDFTINKKSEIDSSFTPALLKTDVPALFVLFMKIIGNEK